MKKVFVKSFTPGQDHGMKEAVALANEAISNGGKDAGLEIKRDTTGMVMIYGYEQHAEESRRLLEILEEAIVWLSPAADSFIAKERKALRNYQALVFGNLKCVGPPLEPYKDSRP